MTKRNSCYTYFKITGDFLPEDITRKLELNPTKQWHVGDTRRNGKTKYDFALWQYGLCDTYDVNVENQMMHTIKALIPKVNELKKIKRVPDIYFTLEIVPSIYVGEINPSLAPNKEVIKFCYETDTSIDIDIYVFDSLVTD